MARNVLASDLLLRLRQVTNTENDTHLQNNELYRFLTSAVSDTWDTLLAAGLGGEGVASVGFNTVAGQVEYSLFSLAPSFYQLKTLYSVQGGVISAGAGGGPIVVVGGLRRPLTRVNPSEEQGMVAPTSISTLVLYYHQAAPVFTTGDETFDGINGWEEHVVQTAAIQVKVKKEDDAGPFRQRKREIEERIGRMANRNQDEPPRIIRRRSSMQNTARMALYNNSPLYFDLRGGNLELYSSWGTYR